MMQYAPPSKFPKTWLNKKYMQADPYLKSMACTWSAAWLSIDVAISSPNIVEQGDKSAQVLGSPDPTFRRPQTLAPAAPSLPLSSSHPPPPSPSPPEDAVGEAVLPTTEAGPLARRCSRRTSRRPAAAAVLVGMEACVCSTRRARGGGRFLRGEL
jgi:hypothetical protein